MKRVNGKEFLQLPEGTLYVRTYTGSFSICDGIEYKSDTVGDFDVWVGGLVDIGEEVISNRDIEPQLSTDREKSRGDYFFKEDEFDIWVLSKKDIENLITKISGCKGYDDL